MAKVVPSAQWTPTAMPSFLASSVISINFWISAMVGPVKSSTGMSVCLVRGGLFGKVRVFHKSFIKKTVGYDILVEVKFVTKHYQLMSE